MATTKARISRPRTPHICIICGKVIDKPMGLMGVHWNTKCYWYFIGLRHHLWADYKGDPPWKTLFPDYRRSGRIQNLEAFAMAHLDRVPIEWLLH